MDNWDSNLSDANIDDLNIAAHWVELDKGLFSDNIGQQCEYIVKLADLFDRYPLPVFINSGFLRLAKVFQNGNNYLKLQVIRIIEKSQKHLQKILSVDEICKLIFYNIHSNDHICRALTLRALAEIASIISDKHNVQHSIRMALESHDEMEAKEAIYAADKFCSVSKSFAEAVFDRISEMIEDIQTPLDRKLRLIPLLVHMHHDTYLSSKAKNLCQAMFYSFPRPDISKIILNTLTHIVCKNLTNIHETLTFFIQLMREEPREKLQLAILRNLNVLAKKVAHLWSFENLNEFISYTNGQRENERTLQLTSEILCKLVQNSNFYFLYLFDRDSRSPDNVETALEDHIDDRNREELKNLIEPMIFHNNIEIAFNFCLFSTVLLVFQSKNARSKSSSVKAESNANNSAIINANELSELVKQGLFSIIFSCDQSIDEIEKSKANASSDETRINFYVRHLKTALKCTIDLVQIKDQAYLDELTEFIDSLLNQTGSNRAEHYCDTLLALTRFQFASSQSSQSKLEERQSFIWNIFLNQIERKRESNDNESSNTLQLKLINLLFELQVRASNNSDSNDSKTMKNEHSFVSNSIKLFVEANQGKSWLIFKLARMCARYAYFKMANDLYAHLSDQLSKSMQQDIDTKDLSYKSWLDFMSIISKAETCITLSYVSNINEFINNLNSAFSLYLQAITLFKSMCTKCMVHSCNSIPALENSNTCFQTRFCELRSEQIKLYIHMILSTMTYQTIPAPVHQFNSSESLGKYGRIAQQLKYSLVELQKLTTKYKEFISECFDADNHSLNILNIIKRQNECLMYCINLISSNKSEQVLREEFISIFLNDRYELVDAFKTKTPADQPSNRLYENSSETKMNENFYLSLYDKLNAFWKQDKDPNSNFTKIKKFQQILIDFIRFSIPIPRAFFNSLQKTQIKLIVNPNTKKTNSIYTIRNDQTLVVKIDGIINQQFKNKEKPVRTIKKVQVCVTTEYDTRAMSQADAKMFAAKYTDIKTNVEEPRNDYFNSNLLINFPYFGNYTIQVDLSLMDDSNSIWRYVAERHQILVKVEEDPNRQKLFAAYAAAAAASTSSAANVAASVPTTSSQLGQHRGSLPNIETLSESDLSQVHLMES